jgi:hypothetical protein
LANNSLSPPLTLRGAIVLDSNPLQQRLPVDQMLLHRRRARDDVRHLAERDRQGVAVGRVALVAGPVHGLCPRPGPVVPIDASRRGCVALVVDAAVRRGRVGVKQLALGAPGRRQEQN